MEPVSQYYYSHRLKLHFWDWGNKSKPNLILLHGGRDHGRSWDRVAEALRADFRIVAPDLRGHGDSSWAPGAMYSLAEYVLDFSALVDIVGGWPIYLIGHSLGGALVMQYAGIYPDRVRKLVSIEGYGFPPSSLFPEQPHERLRGWVEEMRIYERRGPHRYPNIETAEQRMMEANPFLSMDMASHLTLFGSNWNPDGTLVWKFDNYVRAFPPYGFDVADAKKIWSQISCPTLLFRGTESFVEDPEKDGSIHVIPNQRLISVPKAGHWVHHDQPEIFIRETRRFLA